MTGKQNVKALQILVDAVRQAALGDAALTIEPSLLPDGYADVVEAINTLFVRVNETARQHTLLQRSLEQEKAKHERLQANIPGVVYLYQIDLDGSCTFPYVSTSSREHFHLEPEEIMRDGSLLLKLRHPDDVERMEAAIRESAKTLQPFRFEVRHIVDGNVRWHECLSRPTRLPDGTILWDGIMLDISERKKAEETVRRGEFQYRRLYESLTDAFAIVDMDGRIQAVNAAFQNMVGYGEEEIYQFAYPDITPEAWHRREEEIVATQVLKRGYSDVYEKEYRRKDGTVFPVELRTFLLRDEAGRPSGMWAIARDITERKLAEHALHITQYCIEHASIGIYQVDEPDGRIVNANNWACQSMGYTRDELCRLTVFDIDPTFDLARWREHRQALREQGSRTIETYHRRKDGSRFPVEVTINYHSYEGRGFTYSFVRDMSERKTFEQMLLMKDRAIEVSINGIGMSTPDGMMTYANPALVSMWGYDRKEEILGRSATTLYQSPDQAAAMIAELNDKGSWFGVLEAQRRDGSSFDAQLSLSVVKDDYGSVAYLVGSAIDVTESKRTERVLRESEYFLQKSQEVSRTGSYRLDARTGTWTSSRVLDDLFGIGKDFPKTVDGWVELLHPEDRNRVRDYLQNDVLAQGRQFNREYRIVRADNGEERWVHGLGELDFDDRGSPVSMFGTIQDITDRKDTEEEKTRLEARLFQTQKMESVGRLAGGIAHDFNNMLTVIIGYTDLIRGELSSENPVLEEVLEIEKAANHSREITRQLLAFSRKQVIRPVALDLNNVITVTEKTLGRLIGEDIQLKFYAGEGLWKVCLDQSQVDQILVNLALNARDAMPRGGRLIVETANVYLDETYCETSPEAKPGQYISLQVSDNGIGMDKETASRVFEPFYTTKEVGKGTGLGLATVYGIVRQNGGSISVYSEPGRGTTFSIYFPRHVGEETVNDETDDSTSATGTGTILLVEDEEMVRKMTAAALRGLGYSVLVATSPEHAISLCERSDEAIDLLLTDVIMPGMNGRALKERIERLRPDTKCLFMSGYTANAVLGNDLSDEGIRFVQKPFTVRELARKVRAAMEDS